jgi:hypothetical protein
MNRRSRALLLAAAALLLTATLILMIFLSRGRTQGADPATAPGSAHGQGASRDARSAHEIGNPLEAGSQPDAAVVAMPEGLAQDLAIFNSDQLKAELESIALSYPAVGIVSVACNVRPCTAEVQVTNEPGEPDEVIALNTFLDAVSKRFKGYLSASFRDVTTPDGNPAIRGVLFVGGDAPRPAPRYGVE